MKKKAIVLSVFLTVAVLLTVGCGSTTSTTAVPESTAASGLGILAKDGLGIDNSIIGVFSSAMSASGVKASAPSTPSYSGSWWHCTNSYTQVFTYEGTTYTYSHSYDYQFRVWDDSGVEVTIPSVLDSRTSSNISKIWLYSTDTFSSNGASSTMKFGASATEAGALKFEGYNTGTRTITGPMSFSSSYGGTSYEITLTYASVGLNTSGWPSGSINFSVSVNGSATYAGTITYSGGSTATIEFTTGGTGKYSVDLTTGLLTPIT